MQHRERWDCSCGTFRERFVERVMRVIRSKRIKCCFAKRYIRDHRSSFVRNAKREDNLTSNVTASRDVEQKRDALIARSAKRQRDVSRAIIARHRSMCEWSDARAPDSQCPGQLTNDDSGEIWIPVLPRSSRVELERLPNAAPWDEHDSVCPVCFRRAVPFFSFYFFMRRLPARLVGRYH